MFKRKSIALRIAMGYIAVILLTALLVGSSFWILLSRHLEQSARDSLQRDAQNLAELLDNSQEPGGQPAMLMHRMMNFHMLGRVVQGEYLLVTRRGVVADSSIAGVPVGSVLDPAVVETLTRSDNYQGRVLLGNERYVAATRGYGNGGRGWTVVLLTRVESLEEIRQDMLALLLASLGLPFLAAIVITVLLARRITRPLVMLKQKAQQLAERNFGWRVQVDTGDEIGELGEAINVMDEKLAEYDRAQRQFFQNASHELKSPLMSIQGYAEGVRDGIFHGEEAKRALAVIARESGRLKKLVEELVFLGKLESGPGLYVFEETDLEEVLEQAMESQRVIALERNIALEFAGCSDVHIRADGEKLVRVFVNLISNALRHAISRVTVTADALGDTVRVVVRDDGPGFSREDLQHMWDRFYKGPRGGSGLGLSIALAIVQEHGGSIRAGNLPGGGAEMEVLLPVLV